MQPNPIIHPGIGALSGLHNSVESGIAFKLKFY